MIDDTTAGSKILADWVPDQDSTVARRLREAGSVLLGKLNTSEFAFGATTNNPHYGPTRNPWNLDCIPGGSSGGAGAAMAAGLAAGSMGTDTGGSIRCPAALCGIVGLKPTYGRVSTAGVVPMSWSFDHAGPLTRTVEDAALLLGVIAGYDPDDASTVRTPVDDYTAQLGAGVVGLRVGVPRRYFFDRLDEEVRAAVEVALGVLQDLGATVRDVELLDIDDTRSTWLTIGLTEMHAYHAAQFATRWAAFGPDIRATFGHYSPPDAQTLVAAQRHARRVSEALRRALAAVDVLVTPTAVVAAVPIGQQTLHYGGAEEPITAYARCTRPFNVTGLPVLSLPCGFTSRGLPIGLQVAGRPFDEALVLRVGSAYEQATDWAGRHPAGLG